jgi:hypothetical protein
MRFYKTNHGYYYQEYSNGKKKRISKENYLKSTNKSKSKSKPKSKSKLKGGKRPQIFPLSLYHINMTITDQPYLQDYTTYTGTLADDFLLKANDSVNTKMTPIVNCFKLYTGYNDGMGDYIYMIKTASFTYNWEATGLLSKTPYMLWKKKYPGRDSDEFPLIGHGYCYLQAMTFNFFPKKRMIVGQMKYLIQIGVQSINDLLTLHFTNNNGNDEHLKAGEKYAIKSLYGKSTLGKKCSRFTDTGNIGKKLNSRDVKRTFTKHVHDLLVRFPYYDPGDPFNKPVTRDSVQNNNNTSSIWYGLIVSRSSNAAQKLQDIKSNCERTFAKWATMKLEEKQQKIDMKILTEYLNDIKYALSIRELTENEPNEPNEEVEYIYEDLRQIARELGIDDF